MTQVKDDALQCGAHQQRFGGRQSDDWRSMATAPRDGTWVELKCTYGVAPWYCIARWTDEVRAWGRNGWTETYRASKPSWVKPGGGGPFYERSLHWRPYVGEVTSYVDPTGGMQDDPAYWRGAVASKHGLPLDYFEEAAARNAERNAASSGPPKTARRPWWKRIFGG